jgi:hypothetical protein
MALKGNKKRFEEEYEKAKKDADSEYVSEIDNLKKQHPLAYPSNQEPPGRFSYSRRYNKDSANTKDSEAGTISDLAHRKGSKVMDAARVFDMQEDLDKQEKEDESKKNTRFSGLKKLLRGE